MNQNRTNGNAGFCHVCHGLQIGFVALCALTVVRSASGEVSPFATGGEVTRIELPNCRVAYVHTFTNTEEAVCFASTGKRALSVRYLVVGAGGSGSGSEYLSNQNSGGGGGGGGVCEKQGVEFGVNSVWSILVGKGAPSVDVMAGASSISNGVVDVETVPGGGNAGIRKTNSEHVDATEGAAGGGASTTKDYDTYAGAKGNYPSSVLGVVYDKYSGGKSTKRQGGGGGGAGQAGGNAGQVADDSIMSGTAFGGKGLTSDISGEVLVYGSGGGAGECRFENNGKLFRYQGGDGGTRAGTGSKYVVTIEGNVTNVTYTLATSPVANSGGGGAGAGYNHSSKAKERSASTGGADGIVVIRYEVAESPCEGGDKVEKVLKRGTKYSYIHTFTNAASAASFVNVSAHDLKVRYLVVGAGGAGGARYGVTMGGGGGGGGGVCERKDVLFKDGTSWRVCVGKGASSYDDVAGSSSISNGVTDVETVPGGGNGASNRQLATAGAAGGGGMRHSTNPVCEIGAAGEYASSLFGVSCGPFKGADVKEVRCGGGGGGAGAAGSTATSHDGHGGEGLTSDITGEDLVYGSGGGGGFGANGDVYFNGSEGGTRAGNGGLFGPVDTDRKVA